jgi:hypothetical protein
MRAACSEALENQQKICQLRSCHFFCKKNVIAAKMWRLCRKISLTRVACGLSPLLLQLSLQCNHRQHQRQNHQQNQEQKQESRTIHLHDQKQELQQEKKQELQQEQKQEQKQKSDLWEEQRQIQKLKKDLSSNFYLYFSIDCTGSSEKLHKRKKHNPYRDVIAVLDQVTQSPFEAFHFGDDHDRVTTVCAPKQCPTFAHLARAYEKSIATVNWGANSCLCPSMQEVSDRFVANPVPSILCVLTDGALDHTTPFKTFFPKEPVAVFVILVDELYSQQLDGFREQERESVLFHFVDFYSITHRSDQDRRAKPDAKILATEYATFLTKIEKELRRRMSAK